jgi:hypothetical protein
MIAALNDSTMAVLGAATLDFSQQKAVDDWPKAAPDTSGKNRDWRLGSGHD